MRHPGGGEKQAKIPTAATGVFLDGYDISLLDFPDGTVRAYTGAERMIEEPNEYEGSWIAKSDGTMAVG